MEILTEKVISILKDDLQIRRNIAMVMGIGETALTHDIKHNEGKNVAKNYNAINKLLDLTGLTVNDIRTENNN